MLVSLFRALALVKFTWQAIHVEAAFLQDRDASIPVHNCPIHLHPECLRLTGLQRIHDFLCRLLTPELKARLTECAVAMQLLERSLTATGLLTSTAAPSAARARIHASNPANDAAP